MEVNGGCAELEARIVMYLGIGKPNGADSESSFADSKEADCSEANRSGTNCSETNRGEADADGIDTGSRIVRPDHLAKIRDFVENTAFFTAKLDSTLLAIDRAVQTKAHRFVFEMQSHARRWQHIEKEIIKRIQEISGFGADLVKLCEAAVALIDDLSALDQNRKLSVSERPTPDWYQPLLVQLEDIKRQAGIYKAKNGTLVQQMDGFRRIMDQEMVPQSRRIQERLSAAEDLVLQTKWERIEVKHCGFLQDDPIICGYQREMNLAKTEDEAQKIKYTLGNMAASIGEKVTEIFTGFEKINAVIADAAIGVSNVNVLWESILMLLSEITTELEKADCSNKLVLLKHHMSASKELWKQVSALQEQYPNKQ